MYAISGESNGSHHTNMNMTSPAAAATESSSSTSGLPAERLGKHESVQLTRFCWLVGVIGCMGGLSFGYEGPVVSGLIVQPSFLHTFDQNSSNQALISQQSSYCKLNSVPLQLYISCSFITAAVATAVAATWVDKLGRKQFILVAAALIVTANVLQTAATGKAMLFAGRLIMGLGQGFATFTVPLYVAEMSPALVRGRLGTVYSIATTIGQLLAFAVNQAVYAGAVEQGWRVVFAAMAWCPLVMLLLLGFVLPDTPSSLLQRGLLDRAQHSFHMVRHCSTSNLEQEWQGMCSEASKVIATKQEQQLQKQNSKNRQTGQKQQRQHSQKQEDVECAGAAPTADLLAGQDTTAAASSAKHQASNFQDRTWTLQPKALDLPNLLYCTADLVSDPVSNTAMSQGGTGSPWPAAIIMLHLTLLRSFNGFVNVMYFTALLFSSTGNSTRNSLLAQTLMGVSTLLGGVAAMLGIDKVGRQPLLAWMGLAMAVFMAASAAILGTGLPPYAAAAGMSLSPTSTALLMVVLCLWQIAFWSSWGPCFYVLLSELYPLKTRARSVGWGMVTFNLGVVVVLSLGGTMLCSMTYGLLIFFAAVNLYLALFAATCLPETKATGLHEVGEVYRYHWLWKHAYRKQL